MANDVHPPRGMRDFLPVEKLKRDSILNSIRSTYSSYGFQEIETPALETLERLTSGQGGDNEKLAFRVMKRGDDLDRALADQAAESGDHLADLGLRYDLTVPLTRYYATNRSKLPRVFKAIQIGPVWRAERPQKGRYRQFIQCDIDIIGDAGIIAEIELLCASLAALDAIGLGDAQIRFNDRRFLEGFAEASKIPDEKVHEAFVELDKLDKSSLAKVTEAIRPLTNDPNGLSETMKVLFAEENAKLKKLTEAISESSVLSLGKQVQEYRNNVIEKILEGLPKPPKIDFPAFTVSGSFLEYFNGEQSKVEELRADSPRVLSADEALQDLIKIIDVVESRFGKGRLRFDPTLVRGMGYYTGTIFEIEHHASGSSIGGGGRYDGMIGRWIGEDVPAVGISIGFERAIELVGDKLVNSVPSVVLVLDDTSAEVIGVALARQQDLFEHGYAVRLEQRPKKLNLLLDSLAEQGFTHFAAVGADSSSFESLDIKPIA